MKINKKNYKINGYIKIKNFLPKSLLLKIKTELSDIISGVAKHLLIKVEKNDFDYLINNILPKIYNKDMQIY